MKKVINFKSTYNYGYYDNEDALRAVEYCLKNKLKRDESDYIIVIEKVENIYRED